MYGKMQESGLIEIIPLIQTLALWSQDPMLSQPESTGYTNRLGD